MFSFFEKIYTKMELRWVAPAYSGWVMAGLAAFFFAAATNTMAGWLYAISGIMLALLLVSIVLPRRSLRSLQVQRQPIQPVSVGDTVLIDLEIANSGRRAQSLIQVVDQVPGSLVGDRQTTLERIPARGSHHWVETLTAERRGIYRWPTVALRTAAPLGLFWSQRRYAVGAVAVVYPTVLPLKQCPLVDEFGQETSRLVPSVAQSQLATEGVTRTLRPYRWGDSTRLIHWRTSARYGELRIRELEVFTGGQDLLLGLDSGAYWSEEWFEQAVVAIASLYFYAQRSNLSVSLWTAATGVMKGDRLVLETLAEVAPSQPSRPLPNQPLIWLTQTPATLADLPTGSRGLLWQESSAALPLRGLVVNPHTSLQAQLQAPLT